MTPGRVDHLRDFGLRNLVGEYPAFTDPVLMDVHHDAMRRLVVLVEEAFEHVNHELHRRVVVVEKQNTIEVRPFRLRLGLSHPRATGFLRVALEENGSASETVSVPAAGIRASHRRAVHVRLACAVSIDLEPGASAAGPEIH